MPSLMLSAQTQSCFLPLQLSTHASHRDSGFSYLCKTFLPQALQSFCCDLGFMQLRNAHTVCRSASPLHQ